MVIIESLMSLYIKEVLIPEKVVEVVNRFLPIDAEEEIPEEAEDAAIYWINKCSLKLMERIEEEVGNSTPTDDMNDESIPSMVPVEYLWDLSDGKSLASVLALYAPTSLSWKEICYNEPMSAADCVYNLQMVQLFCTQNLPVDILFLTVEDFFDCHRIIRPNILAFIADLLYHFEIKPASCVHRPVVDDHFLTSEEDIDEPPSTTSSSNSGHNRGGINSNGSSSKSEKNRRGKGTLLKGSEWESVSVQSSQRVDGMVSKRRGSEHHRFDREEEDKRRGSEHHRFDREEEDQEVDEEMTRYFSALEMDPEFDSSPEIILLPKDDTDPSCDPYSLGTTPMKGSTRMRKSSAGTGTTSGVTGSASTYIPGSRRSEGDSSNGWPDRPKGHSTPSAKRPRHPPYPMNDPFYGPGPGHSTILGHSTGSNGGRFGTYNKFTSSNVHPFCDQVRGHRNQSIYDKPRNQSIYDKPRNQSIYDKPRMMHRSQNDLPAAGLRRSNSNTQTYARSREFIHDTPVRRHGSSMADLPSAVGSRGGWGPHPNGGAGFQSRQYKPFDTSPFARSEQAQSYHYGGQQLFQGENRRLSRGGSSSTEHSPDRQFQRPHSGHPLPIRRSNSTRTVDRRGGGQRSHLDPYNRYPDDYDHENYEPSPGYHEEYIDDHHHPHHHQQQRRGSFDRGSNRSSGLVHPADAQMSPIDTHIESQVYSDDQHDPDGHGRWSSGHQDSGGNRRPSLDRRRWSEDTPPRSEQFRRRNSREDTLMERSYEGEELVARSNQSHQLGQERGGVNESSSRNIQESCEQAHDSPPDHANRRNTWYVSNEPSRRLVCGGDQGNNDGNVPNIIRSNNNGKQSRDQLRPKSLFIPWDTNDGTEKMTGEMASKDRSIERPIRRDSRPETESSRPKSCHQEQSRHQQSNRGHQEQNRHQPVKESGDRNEGTEKVTSPVRPTTPGVGFVIGKDISEMDPTSELSMARKKELIIEQSLKRKAEQEAKRIQKQEQLAKKKEEERLFIF